MTTTTETILDVRGMSCASCVRHVEGALKKLDGVAAVDVELREGQARIQHDPAKAPVERLIAAIDEAGYASSLVLPRP